MLLKIHVLYTIMQMVTLLVFGIMSLMTFLMFDFHVSGHSLKPISSVKLLGVKIGERLTFDDLISALCAKASYQINALRRIVEYLTPENRMSIYNAFIASNCNYCNTVWHFCSNQSLYKLEKLHKQALR